MRQKIRQLKTPTEDTSISLTFHRRPPLRDFYRQEVITDPYHVYSFHAYLKTRRSTPYEYLALLIQPYHIELSLLIDKPYRTPLGHKKTPLQQTPPNQQ